MDYENQLCGKGWIGDGCRLQTWGLIGVLPGVLQDFSGFVQCKKILESLYYQLIVVVVVAHIYPSVTRQRQTLTYWTIRTLFITTTTS